MSDNYDIKSVRESLGLSPEQFSKVIGCSHTSVYNWEKGHCSPTQLAKEKLDRIARKVQKK